jgi:hypothetical protein
MMEVLDALTAEDRRVFTAVEMLDSLVMGLTQIRRNLKIKFSVFFFSI